MAKKYSRPQKEQLFIDTFVPAEAGSGKLFEFDYEYQNSQPVDCLGMSFPNDDARRSYFKELLREKLKEPSFRATEGFPIGDDEDILAMSDPPYYTACPNPFTTQLIAAWSTKNDLSYDCKPFATDVSEGKGDYLYSAHSYPTKVPPQAIARYILHYTKPGDLVLDPFCGSGMTGLAAVLCGRKDIIDPDDSFGDVCWGARIPIVSDLSPAATFITSVYLNPPQASVFFSEATKLLNATVNALSDDWQLGGKNVSYFVKSELFGCPHCNSLVVSDHVVRMTDTIGAASSFNCPECQAVLSKAPSKNSNATRVERRLVSRFDKVLGVPRTSRHEKTVGVMLSDGTFRKLSSAEADVVDRVDEGLSHWLPTNALIQGDRNLIKDCCASYGITHIHDFYTPRLARMISSLWNDAMAITDYRIRSSLLFFINSYSLGATRLNRFIPARDGKSVPGSQINRYFTGTLYVPSMMSEVSPDYLYRNKIVRLKKAFEAIVIGGGHKRIVSTESATKSSIPSDSIDYIFVDPPFGKNLQYSELNQVWESWIRIFANRSVEAVIDDTRRRDVFEYGRLMKLSFKEMFRVLKPNRWITLEFHNSYNAVWAAIQEGLAAAGFVVADVRVLDKQQDTYKQSRQGLVKQDLVISAYKPPQVLEHKLQIRTGTEEIAWEFVATHLGRLPVFLKSGTTAEIIAERQDYLLFDRMIAFFVERGSSPPLSFAEFREGLLHRFPHRDGMYFLPAQIPEYDSGRLAIESIQQYELFVRDEKSAILWVRNQLVRRPMSYQELQPIYMKEAQRVWEKYEQPLELQTILEQNFVKDAGDTWRTPDPKRESDLEQLRHRTLMHEFLQYVESKGNLKIVRTEAIREGFRECWQKKDYTTIVQIAKRVPDAVIQEDPALLMYFDNASLLLGE